MFRTVLLSLLIVTLSGCATHNTLRKDTGKITNTLADLQFQQVLDNVARFHDDPFTIPSFAVVSVGTVSLNDMWAGGFNPTYAPTLTAAQQGGGPVILQMLFPFNAQRTLTENWSLTPVTDADNLRRLRDAFQLLVLATATPNYERRSKILADFFAGDETVFAIGVEGTRRLPTGWYGVGGKKDVPKNVCYVGKHCDTYVWVTPEGTEGLAIFTIAALDLATGESNMPQKIVVRTYKGEATSENLIETKVTTTETDEKALEEIHKGMSAPRDRIRPNNLNQFNPGLLLQPRP